MKDNPGLLDKLTATLSALFRGWKLPVGVERDDLVQEVCSRCLRQIPPVGDGGADEAPLLLGVAKNVAREWWRAERLRERHHAKVAGWRGKFGVEEHTLMDAEELRAGLLRRLVGLMSEEDAELLLAVRWDGQTWGQALARLGVEGARAVEQRRKKILRILSDEGLQKSLIEWLGELGVRPHPPPTPLLY